MALILLTYIALKEQDGGTTMRFEVGRPMQPDATEGKVLLYLYERYERLGPDPVMLQDADWEELQRRTGADKRRIGHLLEELVEDGYAKGERLADTLGPREGLVEISARGRRTVRAWLNPPPPPAPQQIEVTRFGQEAFDQLEDFFARLDLTTVDPAMVEEVKQLLLDLNSSETNEETRLSKLSQLVGVAAGSQQLIAAAFSHAAPSISVLVRLLPT